ncbi:uncharacterized protein [Pyrus communis]|uniref:uncharacterized protein n=1 Tax=Pyrus communis TaxID=23211 RepID=UPI0035C17E87
MRGFYFSEELLSRMKMSVPKKARSSGDEIELIFLGLSCFCDGDISEENETFHFQTEMSIFPIQSLDPFEATKKSRVCVSKMWRQKVFKSDIRFSHLHCILVDALVDLKEIKYAGDLVG